MAIAIHFCVDMAIVWMSFLFGIYVRFGYLDLNKLSAYLSGIAIASFVLPSLLYVGGLYSARGPEGGVLSHIRALGVGLLGILLVVLAMGSLDFSARLGRGVLVIGLSALIVAVTIHHLFLSKQRNHRWQTVLCLVSGREDETAAALLGELWGRHCKILGIVTGRAYQPLSKVPVMGTIEEMVASAKEIKISVVLVRDRHLADPEFGPLLRQMRYEGVDIVSLADACEEAYQAVPLELVTESWLFRASTQSGLFYVKKFKRMFDVLASLFFLVVLSPLLLVGMAIVKLNSPGPIFFRQKRSGRLGNQFVIYKLRTMHVDSERDGAKWCTAGDSRIFPGGNFLRKFRFDEIPQLINVLRGEMSFVGPRPEQPEFVTRLTEEIPRYPERLLIQPGLTGWAQVRYPYGATVDDARRKLEFDLYYMKHMSVLLDFFILIETVKIILLGGVKRTGLRDYSRFREGLTLGQDDAPVTGPGINQDRPEPEAVGK